MHLGWVFVFIFDGLVFHFDNEFRAFQNEERSVEAQLP